MINPFHLPTFHLIALHEYPKRRENTERILTTLNIPFTTCLFRADKDNAERGCRNSHVALSKYCIDQDWPFIIILEDNVQPTATQNIHTGSFQKLLRCIRSPNIWQFCDIILLAAVFFPHQNCSSVSIPTLADIFVQTHNHIHGASCYIISRRACERVWKEYMQNDLAKLPIDSYYTATFRQWMFRPLLFHHGAYEKSIVNPGIDWVRKLYFHPSVYKRVEAAFFEQRLPWLFAEIVIVSISIFALFVYLIVKRMKS